jgi:hypothetical protein
MSVIVPEFAPVKKPEQLITLACKPLVPSGFEISVIPKVAAFALFGEIIDIRKKPKINDKRKKYLKRPGRRRLLTTLCIP